MWGWLLDCKNCTWHSQPDITRHKSVKHQYWLEWSTALFYCISTCCFNMWTFSSQPVYYIFTPNHRRWTFPWFWKTLFQTLWQSAVKVLAVLCRLFKKNRANVLYKNSSKQKTYIHISRTQICWQDLWACIIFRTAMRECVFIWHSTRVMKLLGKAGDNSLYTNRPFSSCCSTNLKCYFKCQENAIPVCSFFLKWTYFSISKIIVGIWYFSPFVEYLGMLCWEPSTTTWYASKSAA